MSSVYKTEGYIKELAIMDPDGQIVSFEPAKEWVIERDGKKLVLLEDSAATGNKGDAKEIPELKVKLESPCDQCLIKNLVAIKINKSRVRITVEADGTQFKLKSITLI